MLMSKMTQRQNDVLNVIKEHITDHSMPPTRQEIADILGFKSANAADVHIKALVRKKVLVLRPGVSRGIFPVRQKFDANKGGIPLLGKVAAGIPICADCNETDRIKMDPNLFRPAADFFLTVEGESMKDIGLFNGDLLAVHHTKTACNGQVVVARWNNQVTVKRFYREGSFVRLVAENKDFTTINVDLEQESFEIDGVMVGSIRKYCH